MRAGYGASVVPVEPGEALGGYGARTGGAEGVLDPIEVHALVFFDGRTRFALVVVDVICVNTDLVQSLRAELASHDIAHAWITATHTHAAPETGCRPGGTTTPAGIAERLTVAVVTAVSFALGEERPVVVSAGRVTSWGVGEVRNLSRASAHPVPVDFVTFREPDGTHRGTLLVSPIHPTVLAAGNRQASADLAGAIRRATTRRMGGWAVAATGAAGDVSTRTTRREQTPEEADRLAGLLVDAVLAGDAKVAAGTEGIRVDARTATLAPNLGASAPAVPAIFGDDRWAGRRRTVFEEAMRLVGDLGGHPEQDVVVPVEAVNLGGVGIVAVAGELFLGVGERIRSGTDPGTIVLGYANGYVGYLPDRDAPPSYETVVSPVDAAAIDDLVETAWLGAEAVGLRRR